MSNVNHTFELFKKYLKYTDPTDAFKFATLKPMIMQKDEEYEQGDKFIEAVEFGWLKIAAYKKRVELIIGFKEIPEYFVYEGMSTGGTYWEPPDYDEILLNTDESAFKTFLFCFSRLVEENLNNCLIAEDFEFAEKAANTYFENDGLTDEQRTICRTEGLLPFVVNCDWESEELQFACEAENEAHAREQCENAYPNCLITKVIGKGEE